VCRHPEETEVYRRLLADETTSSAAPSDQRMSDQWRAILAHNIESYTIQWDEFDYSETTWGFSIEQRFEMILDELGIQGKLGELEGKRHVDAACGNGTLALRTAEIGMETFAFDQSHSIERADAFAREHGLPQRGIVHFIHGNLVAPPLAPGSFDMLYSGGAIHMTPSFVHTLHKLAELLKPRGSRIYVWTGRRRVVVGMLYDLIRRFLKIFPIGIRRGVARAGVVPYMMIQWVMRLIYGEKAFPKLSFNENLVRFLDAASHRFGDIPTAEEFEAMVAEMDFDSQETKRPGHRGYGILAIHNP
jgi:SAM-dependent methyltransferase